MATIEEKALLDERSQPLYQQMHALLKHVLNFTYKKTKFFYPGALHEFEN